MDRASYHQQILSLLPRGDAWTREEGSTLGDLIDVIAGEFARVDERSEALLIEANPTRATEALPDWERVLGLPDECAGDDQTIDGRRQRVIQKRALRGGQSRAYLIELADALGYVVGVTTFAVATCESECTAPIYNEPWRFAFRIDAPAETIREATCESGCDEALRTWGNDVLECAIRRHTHSHNFALFGYGA